VPVDDDELEVAVVPVVPVVPELPAVVVVLAEALESVTPVVDSPAVASGSGTQTSSSHMRPLMQDPPWLHGQARVPTRQPSLVAPEEVTVPALSRVVDAVPSVALSVAPPPPDFDPPHATARTTEPITSTNRNMHRQRIRRYRRNRVKLALALGVPVIESSGRPAGRHPPPPRTRRAQKKTTPGKCQEPL
jgi:hypothetical protein